MKEGSCQIAKDQNRPVVYVLSAGTDKDELARQIAAKDKITNGLVAILTCVEPCMSFEIYRNKDQKKLEREPGLDAGIHPTELGIDPVVIQNQALARTIQPSRSA